MSEFLDVTDPVDVSDSEVLDRLGTGAIRACSLPFMGEDYPYILPSTLSIDHDEPLFVPEEWLETGYPDTMDHLV